MTKEQQNELYRLAEPIVQWIRLFGHPHMKVVIDTSLVNVVETNFSCPALKLYETLNHDALKEVVASTMTKPSL